MSHKFSFPKQEHLCGEIPINRLFTQGKAFIAYPLRVVYIIDENKDLIPVKILVNVPKKRFKRAVKRNRIKRLMREAYRLNKPALIDFIKQRNLNLQIAFNYVSDEEFDFNTIEKQLVKALKKISDKIETER
ncbi:MAG: ribonuclease P protein component [Paludibacter sp.]|nr:ribonuclease P protein component [Paludibacter sp.]